MAQSTALNRKKKSRPSISYVAVKAKNEIYYQMASVFHAMSHGRGELARVLVKSAMPARR